MVPGEHPPEDGSPREDGDLDAARARMIAHHLVARGIDDTQVLAAMAAVPRECFVPSSLRPRAYEDSALPIGSGQTISQPYMVARSCAALNLSGGERVLEIGGGSGYQAAVLARLAAEVVTVEIVPELADSARRNLAAAGVDDRVRVVVGDGVEVARREGPFDAIVLAAASRELPEGLLRAVRPGGVVVGPVGPREQQRLLRFHVAEGGEVDRIDELDACVFVPLLGG